MKMYNGHCLQQELWNLNTWMKDKFCFDYSYHISGIEIKNSSVLHECLLLGFPNSNPEENKKEYMYLIIGFYTPNTIYTSRDYSRIIV